MKKKRYQFLVSTYLATGEGKTVSILITKGYGPGTKEENANAQFLETFGAFMTQGVKNLSYDEFMKGYKQHLPGWVANVLQAEPPDVPGGFKYSSQVHVNYS